MQNLRERQYTFKETVFDVNTEDQSICTQYKIFPLTLDSRHIFNINYDKMEQSKLVKSIREKHAYLSHISQFEEGDLLNELWKRE
jgi:hypothetical protein